MSVPLILSVETATLSGSVALSRGDEILGVVSGDASISHSNTLLGDVDKLLTQTNIALPEIDLFAVATGPGSFTGLRIGIATTKALAATLDRPTAGIPTLEAVALAGGVSEVAVALLPPRSHEGRRQDREQRGCFRMQLRQPEPKDERRDEDDPAAHAEQPCEHAAEQSDQRDESERQTISLTPTMASSSANP